MGSVGGAEGPEEKASRGKVRGADRPNGRPRCRMDHFDAGADADRLSVRIGVRSDSLRLEEFERGARGMRASDGGRSERSRGRRAACPVEA